MSCATNLSNVEISRLELRLVDGKTVPEALVPGTTYLVDILIFNAKGEPVKHPDMRGIKLTSPNNSFIDFTVTDNNQLYATASPESFSLLDSQFEFMLDVNKNDFPRQEYSWPVDWANYNVFNFRGRDGAPGKNGDSDFESGAKVMTGCCLALGTLFSSDDSSSRRHGRGSKESSGDNGGNGKSGSDAHGIVIDVAYYIHQGRPGVIVYERNTKRLFFMPVHSFTVDASGGEGGKGGDGGDGMHGTAPDIGGDGGRGGDGGDGGNGGDITVYYPSGSDVIDLAGFITRAGRGGRGGAGGDGGTSFDGGEDGHDGYPGRDGRDGRDGKLIEKTAINPDSLFLNVPHPEFRRENLRFSRPK